MEFADPIDPRLNSFKAFYNGNRLNESFMTFDDFQNIRERFVFLSLIIKENNFLMVKNGQMI